MALKLITLAMLAVSAVAFAPIATLTASTHRHRRRSSSTLQIFASKNTNNDDDDNSTSSITRRSVMYSLAGLTVSPLFLPTLPASARLEGVNKPELLPSEPGLNVIQVEKFLTKGQEKRLNDLLIKLEADTGYRVRVLCQAYPRTPG